MSFCGLTKGISLKVERLQYIQTIALFNRVILSLGGTSKVSELSEEESFNRSLVAIKDGPDPRGGHNLCAYRSVLRQLQKQAAARWLSAGKWRPLRQHCLPCVTTHYLPCRHHARVSLQSPRIISPAVTAHDLPWFTKNCRLPA